MPVIASPAAGRAARVLKALAAAPERELSLSEVARRVNLNRTSCQTLLLALVDEGLVTRREPGPAYRLGPALIHLGEAAKSSLDVVDLVEPHLDALRDRFGLTAMAGLSTGSEIVVAVVRAAAHPLGLTVVTGGRLPFRAPLGPIYVAWADDETIAAWLRRAEPSLGRTHTAQTRRGLDEIRRRGYSVTVRAARRARTRAAAELAQEELTAARLAERNTLRVVGISAAVWDRDGAMACSLALTGFTGDLTPTEVTEAAEAVRDTAQLVTGVLGGHQPDTPLQS